MREPLFQKPDPEAMVRLLEEDLERVRAELTNEVQTERERRYTLMMRVKRTEEILKVLVQFVVMGVGIAAFYWGVRFFREGELWWVVTIVLWVGGFMFMLHEADSKKKEIEKREAEED